MRTALRHQAPAFLVFLIACTLAFIRPTIATAKGPDPAERGLDLFIHAPSSAIAGDSFTVDFIAYGFPSVTVAKPLAGATLQAAWDPETTGVASAGDINATTDALGHARIDIPVPLGETKKIALLIELRHGEHVRTRKIDVNRTARTQLELRVPDASVVPGSQVPAWITVTDSRAGSPVPNASVDVALLEGDVERALEHVTTDASGFGRTSFYIPQNTTGTPGLQLRARLGGTGTKNPVENRVGLSLREETPATPHLRVKWKELQLKPAEMGHVEIRLLDAADEPIAEHAVLHWIGPKGTTPPKTEEEWKKIGTVSKTDGLGQIVLESQAPKVVKSVGSALTVVVQTEIEGQKLDQTRTITVGQPIASASLDLEGEALAPGLAQRAYLHVSDGEKGVAGEFSIEADGLKTKATTDKEGDAEVTWTVPEDIGAARDSGPCAGGVAAAVVVRQTKPIPALARHPEPFELCVSVARDRSSLLRTSVQVARIGDKVRASLVASKRAARGQGSVVVTSVYGFGETFWTSTSAAGVDAEIDLTRSTMGLHDITVAIPQASKAAETSAARILVLPRVIPKLESKLAGGHIAPGGEAEVDVTLTDGHGAPIMGSVTAVIIDKEGGGDVRGLEAIDTRNWLCAQVGAPRERCDAFLEGDASADLLRRSLITTSRATAHAPLADPAADTTGALTKTFSDVLHSLEGAVFQSNTPESLRDVRRKENGRWVFNPELMTLVTASMSEPPTTPGGEPFGLVDLIAVDPQVTFDNVARRITRLKIFNVLAAMRTARKGEALEPDEPVLKDPNAMLRQLVRDGTLQQDALLDPWGGTIQFIHSGAPPTPFITAAKGWALQAPGPDGRAGTADDVKDPFERVVRSTSPYATAMGEDEIVDAKWNMRVGDATVTGWQDMFARLTGTILGHGSGSGTGQGFGEGHGRLGGSHISKSPTIRSGSSMVTETARWTEPARTDAKGHVRIKVPLGDYETTWRIAFLARTDAGQTATGTLDVPTFLPISAQVDIGRKLTLGDEVSARIIVRNRTQTAKNVALEIGAEGGLQLRDQRAMSVTVPANAVRSVFTRVAATAEGKGKVTVAAKGGTDSDRTTHDVNIEPPGELRVLTSSTWIGNGKQQALRIDLPPGYVNRGNARLVLESGFEDALLAALASVEPQPGSSPETLADAIEIAARIEKVAESQGKRWLVTRTRKVAALARAHLAAVPTDKPGVRTRVALERAHLFPAPKEDGTPGVHAPKKVRGKDGTESSVACPKDEDLPSAPISFFLEAEPAPEADGPFACFTSLTTKTESKAPLDLARNALALFDRPHRTPLATTLAAELARTTRAQQLAPTGTVAFDGPRAERAIVIAALTRSAHTWQKDPNTGRHLIEMLLAMRDVRGGYGSSEATRDAVRAIVAFEQAKPQASRIVVIDGSSKQTVNLAPNGSQTVSLGAQTRAIEVEVSGAARVLARFERPALRNYVAAPDTSITPVAVSVDWPNDAKAGSTNVVHVTYKSSLGRNATVWTRLPLPPGVDLAAAVPNAKLRQGVVHIRLVAGEAETIALPMRFTLPGKTLIPEAETHTVSEESPRTLTPARPLIVK